MNVHYLDNSATTPVAPEIKKAVAEALELYGNPSSLHFLGYEAEKALSLARGNVAASLGAGPGEIFFTSGGTEANNLALFGAAYAKKRRGNRIVLTDSEHPSVLACAAQLEKEGFEVVRLSTKGGAIDFEQAKNSLTKDVILLSVMHTNNETGAVYPVRELAAIAKRQSPEAIVHCDCVQAYMKTPISAAKLGVDLISVSAHKIHALKGTGALYVRKGCRILSRTFGGEQENALRPGTQNTVGIIALGEAASLGLSRIDEFSAHTASLRQQLLTELSDNPLISFHIPPVFAPNLLNFSVRGIRSETLLHYLSSKGIYLSSGSACSSKKGTSGVLFSFGLSREEADCALRASFSRYNTSEDVLALSNALKDIDKVLSGR